jgi:hypothetical protein
MKRKVSIIVTVFFSLTLLAMLVQPSNVWAQSERTVGLIKRDIRAFDGYNLFKTLPGNTFNLTNNAGNLIHSWVLQPNTRGAYYLLENGNLLLGWNRLTVFEVDWDGNMVWEFSNPAYRAHHDWYKLDNGNVLMIAWETKTRDEAIAAGRNPNAFSSRDGSLWVSNELWPDAILEYDPDADEIVWEWHSWDHIIQDYDSSKPNYGDPSSHPESIDLNYFYANLAGGADWQHFNAINYNSDLDQIAISVPCFNEIWIIDHSTSTAEAASDTGGRYGKGGRLLYRWGNPEAYGRGTNANRQLEFEHDVQWITPGYPGENNLLIYNNGAYRGYSSVVEIVTPVDSNGSYPTPAPGTAFGPSAPLWEYVAPVPSDFFSGFISGASRLPNGNTVINEGDDGTFFEVTPNKEIVWKYINPVARPFGPGQEEVLAQGEPRQNNAVHRVLRYAPDFPGLTGKDLTPDDPIETYLNFYYVDIRPGSCKNPVNRVSRGVLPVAILGSEYFDVETIDPSSILLEGFPADKWSIEDVGAIEECDGKDGYPDLVLKWDSELIKVALSNTSKGDEFLLRLTGYSSDGWFLGREGVIIKK